MNKFFLLILFFVASSLLFSAITIEYDNSLSSEDINTKIIDEIEYFNVYEMDKTFRAVILEDILDRRLYVNIYNKQLIFLLDSSYIMFQNKTYNFSENIIRKNEIFYISVKFLTNILPDTFEEIKYENGKILAAAPTDNRIRKIVIDPGHGGKDPGAIGNSKKHFEKEVVLLVGKALKKKLQDELGVTALLTRDKDEYVSLQERTDFANKNEADLFISIHCNAHRNSKVDGIEVFYLSSAKTDEARAVEAMENQVVYDYEGGEEAINKYDELAFILADMAQSEHLEESYQLSAILQNDLIEATNNHDRGVKQANFYVLRGAFMPAVLLELGFMTNNEGEKKLIKESYQKKMVDAIFESVKEFKLKYDAMQ